jgi:serine/threonine-protein kinase
MNLAGSPYIFGVPAPYEEVNPFREGMAAVRLGEKWGYVNTHGELAIPAMYDNAFDFRYGAACVVTDRRASLIDKDGHTLLETGYIELEKQADGWIMARDEKTLRFGCLNPAGELTIPCKYSYMEFGDGELIKAVVGKLFKPRETRYGFVNRQGEEVVPFLYTGAEAFCGGYAEVTTEGWRYSGGKWGLIDETGAAVIPPRYYRLDQLGGLVRFALSKEAIGVMDIAGNIILPAAYQDIFLYSDGVIGADKGDLCGLFNPDGSELLPFRYDYLYLRWDDLELIGAAVGGKEGYISRFGEVKIPFIYDDVYRFSGSHAVVKQNHKLGVIDSLGNQTVPCIYDDIWHICGGLTIAKTGDGVIILDAERPALPPLNNAHCLKFTDGRAWLQYGGLWHVLGRPGKI